MKRVTIILGLDFDRSNTAIPSAEAEGAVQWILQTAAKRFGGCTLIRTLGSWDSGSCVAVEHGLKVEIITPAESLLLSIREFAEELRDLLRQQSVGYVIESVPDVEFI